MYSGNLSLSETFFTVRKSWSPSDLVLVIKGTLIERKIFLCFAVSLYAGFTVLRMPTYRNAQFIPLKPEVYLRSTEQFDSLIMFCILRNTEMQLAWTSAILCT